MGKTFFCHVSQHHGKEQLAIGNRSDRSEAPSSRGHVVQFKAKVFPLPFALLFSYLTIDTDIPFACPQRKDSFGHVQHSVLFQWSNFAAGLLHSWDLTSAGTNSYLNMYARWSYYTRTVDILHQLYNAIELTHPHSPLRDIREFL